MVSVIDLTKQKQYEKELISEKEKLKKYLDIANLIIGVIGKDGKIKMINKKGCEILEGSEEEIIGKNWHDTFLPEETRKKAKEVFRKEIKHPDKDVYTYEGTIKTLNSKIKLIRWIYTYLKDENGNIIGEFATGEDITELRNMENLIQKNKNLESLGTLAGGIAHDFNNILTGISSNISLIKMIINKNNPIYDSIIDIENASKKALDLSTQLLTFAKGGNPITKPESISQIIKENINFYASGSKINFSIHAPENLWNVKVDKNQISQVFTNLIINAKQAMEDEGKISVTLSNTRITKKVY